MTQFLHILNSAPVSFSTGTDSSGDLDVLYNNATISGYDNSIFVQDQNLPQLLKIFDFSDSSGQWKINAEHEDENDQVHHWTRHNNQGCCSFSWSATNQVHKVTVTATNGSASKVKLVFIKVRPHPEQPDPT